MKNKELRSLISLNATRINRLELRLDGIKKSLDGLCRAADYNCQAFSDRLRALEKPSSGGPDGEVVLDEITAEEIARAIIGHTAECHPDEFFKKTGEHLISDMKRRSREATGNWESKVKFSTTPDYHRKALREHDKRKLDMVSECLLDLGGHFEDKDFSRQKAQREILNDGITKWSWWFSGHDEHRESFISYLNDDESLSVRLHQYQDGTFSVIYVMHSSGHIIAIKGKPLSDLICGWANDFLTSHGYEAIVSYGKGDKLSDGCFITMYTHSLPVTYSGPMALHAYLEALKFHSVPIGPFRKR